MKAVHRDGPISFWEAQIDRGGNAVGPIFCTAVYTSVLAMPYHYIPLYQR